MDPVVSAEIPSRVNAIVVTFEPGARTAWHTHPAGQTIYVQSGICLAQKEGEAIETLRPGDTATFAPGEKHWHGAGPDCAMVHLAMQETVDGASVDWMAHVTDAEYSGAQKG